MSDEHNVVKFRKRPQSSDSGPEAGDFQSFVQCIGAGDLPGAAKHLRLIFNIPEPRSIQCANWFMERASANPAFVKEAQQLRVHLMAGDTNALLQSLHQAFGLQGPEAILAVGRMQSALGK